MKINKENVRKAPKREEGFVKSRIVSAKEVYKAQDDQYHETPIDNPKFLRLDLELLPDGSSSPIRTSVYGNYPSETSKGSVHFKIPQVYKAAKTEPVEVGSDYEYRPASLEDKELYALYYIGESGYMDIYTMFANNDKRMDYIQKKFYSDIGNGYVKLHSESTFFPKDTVTEIVKEVMDAEEVTESTQESVEASEKGSPF